MTRSPRTTLFPYTTLFRSTGGTMCEHLNFYIQKGINRTKEITHLNDLWSRIGFNHNDLRMVFRAGNIHNAKVDNRYWYDPIKNRLFASSFHLSPDDVELYVSLLNKYKPKFIHVYPSTLVIICNVIINYGFKINHHPIGIL